MFYETITKQEIQVMENEHGFTPNYTYEDYVIVKNDDGEIVEEYYINLAIHKTADEVYQEWLESKDNPPIQQSTLEEIEERVLTTENAILDILAQQMVLTEGVM